MGAVCTPSIERNRLAIGPFPDHPKMEGGTQIVDSLHEAIGVRRLFASPASGDLVYPTSSAIFECAADLLGFAR
jgi:hypothetical protein